MRTATGGLLRPRREPRPAAELADEVVHSFTTPGLAYRVRQLPDGSWCCECKDYTCRLHDCKHIVYVRDKRAA